MEHGVGVTLFMSALLVKALGKAASSGSSTTSPSTKRPPVSQQTAGERPEEQGSALSRNNKTGGDNNNSKPGFLHARWNRQKKLTSRESIDMELGTVTD
uniref:Uncharacterized protein n=2 Tax=Grammatophora oceanica TaxID=210454 RepID=A0A7S1YMU4_9STRA